MTDNQEAQARPSSPVERPSLTPERIARLSTLAARLRANTRIPSPWLVVQTEDWPQVAVTNYIHATNYVHLAETPHDEVAEYFAALDPEFVRSLLDEREAAARVIEAAREIADTHWDMGSPYAMVPTRDIADLRAALSGARPAGDTK